MKDCPHCHVPMIEVKSSVAVSAPEPPQLQADGPVIQCVSRARFQCPQCHHLEEAYPTASV
jgi:nitrate reductase cytochrome c-type subunit